MKNSLAMRMENFWNRVPKPIKFFVINGLGGVLALVLFHLMTHRSNYSNIESALASQFFCQLFNFFPQKYAVFKEKDFRWPEIKREFLQYIAAGTIIIGFNIGLMAIADYFLLTDHDRSQIVISFILNFPSYILNEKVFKKMKPA